MLFRGPHLLLEVLLENVREDLAKPSAQQLLDFLSAANDDKAERLVELADRGVGELRVAADGAGRSLKRPRDARTTSLGAYANYALVGEGLASLPHGPFVCLCSREQGLLRARRPHD